MEKKTKMISYVSLQSKYPNEYVARKDDRIFAHAGTYDRLLEKIKKAKLNRSRMTIGFVPPKDKPCIYVC